MQKPSGPFSTAPGPRRTWSFYTIWAEDGLVFLEDKEDGAVTVHTCAQARGRLKGWIVDEVHTWDLRRTAAVAPTEKGFCNDMFFKMRKMLEVVELTLEEAVQQGDQNDPQVAEQKLREFMRSRLSGRPEGSRLPSLTQYMERQRPLVQVFRATPK